MLRNDNIIGKLRAGAASVDKQRGKKNAIIELAADLSKALHDEYIQEYESLSHQQRAWIAALVDTDSSEYHVGKIFKPSPAAYKIHLGFITGELSPKFTLDELKRFLTINEVSFRNDWRDRLEFIAASDTGKAGAAVDTGKDDTRKGYKILTKGAENLRAMLYKARQKEIERAEKEWKKKHGTQGENKGKYCAKPWPKWIPEFTKKKAVQKLLHEQFNLKSGKGYIQVAASTLDVKGWRFIHEQERIERLK